jgi:hypothetical protein
MNIKPVIYCICYATDDGENKLPKHKSKNYIIIPVIRKNMNKNLFFNYTQYVEDDTKDNISKLLGHPNLNPYFGDLTSLYWVWKNVVDENAGVCHYRRFWDEDEIINSNPNVLYVKKQILWNCNMARQYYESHGVGIDAPRTLYNLSVKNKIPINLDMLDIMWDNNIIYTCNMIRGPKKLFDQFCEILFSILFPLWEEIKDDVFKLDIYQRRSIAFIAERIVTAIVLNSEYFFGKDKIKESSVHFYE